MKPPFRSVVWGLAAIACCLAGDAAAVNLESLVSPGELVASHAKWDTECTKCHAAFSKNAQRGLCLDCHDKVAADIRAGKGFHGHFAPARTAQCSTCHTDHQGRKADIERLDPQTFNHAMTEFRLAGAHVKVTCESCHKPGKKRREAATSCNGCHAADDTHKGALGTECATCHRDSAWLDVRFDHTRDTKWPLTGGHVQTACKLCHAGQRYKNTPTDCLSCHRIDDVHAGRNGADCKACHNTASWKKSSFDHRQTRFPLEAKHAQVACTACHPGKSMRDPVGRECFDCHRGDDQHHGQNGEHCADCHTAAAWSEAKFDHAAKTKFPLRGAHEHLQCNACHKGPVNTVKLQMECIACHAAEDVHAGAMGKNCSQCHGEVSWKANVRFDHDLTRFPLVGLHATAACEACHVNQKFRGTPLKCVDCHTREDAHKGRLGAACGDCHNPNDWKLWSFDHNTRTHFPLEGAHAGIACVACHTRPLWVDRHMSSECATCHRRDDVHQGQFGADCARCHTTTSFAVPRRVQ